MVKKKQASHPPYVLVFVEGDTDEVFFRTLIDYYASISARPLLPYEVCNLRGVTRYSSKLLAKLKNEYLPKARSAGYRIKTVCCSYDTDVFEARQPNIVNWNAIGKSVKRMGIDDFIRVGVASSIEDWMLDNLQGICNYLHLRQIPAAPKGANGYQKLTDLYAKAHKTYRKGVETSNLIKSLNMQGIHDKRREALVPLEDALGVIL